MKLRILVSFIIFSIFPLFSKPAGAQSDVRATFIIDSKSDFSSEVQALKPSKRKPFKNLLALSARMHKAVILGSDIDPSTLEEIRVHKKHPLTKGQLLMGAEQIEGTYCAPMRSKGLGMAGPCLQDTDLDGSFDIIVKAGYTSASPDIALITDKGKIVGADLQNSKQLTEPIPYADTELAAGPTVEIQLKYMARYDKKEPKLPITGYIWFDTSKDPYHEAVFSQPVSFQFNGEPILLAIEGVKLRVSGFDRRGFMQYQILSVERSKPISLQYREPVQIQIIGY